MATRDETYQENRGHKSWQPMTEKFTLEEMKFYPFKLSKRHRIPSDIIELLQLNQYVTPILVCQPDVPFVNAVDFHPAGTV